MAAAMLMAYSSLAKAHPARSAKAAAIPACCSSSGSDPPTLHAVQNDRPVICSRGGFRLTFAVVAVCLGKTADEAAMTTSRLPGFHNLKRDDRLTRVAAETDLTPDQVAYLRDQAMAGGALAENLSENVIGVMALPLSVATNLIVDGRDVLVPMVTEESSVVAAVCNGARACRTTGGVTSDADAPRMIAQIQLTNVPDLTEAHMKILSKKDEISGLCDACDPMLVHLGGGFRDIDVRLVGDF
ncbi:MAG TPA: hypothetical protein ENK28_12890, partial [Aliiroseovarius sp.]|nr:hypothetical protein [Aliiroseovarius sp.]